MVYYTEQDFSVLQNLRRQYMNPSLLKLSALDIAFFSIINTSVTIEQLYRRLSDIKIQKEDYTYNIYFWRKLFNLMFDTPFEDLPLRINETTIEKYHANINNGAIIIEIPDHAAQLIAKWRLKIGK